MGDPLRPTAHSVSLTNAHTNPPNNGTEVWALTRGGKLCETRWTDESILYFDAYCGYPTIPADVKALQLARYILKETTNENH